MSDTARLLKDILSIEDVCDALGIEVQKIGANKSILCPEHAAHTGHADGNFGNCFFNKHNGYHCFACDCSGDIVSLVMYTNNCDFQQALEFLKNLAGITEGKFNKNLLPPLKRDQVEFLGLNYEALKKIYKFSKVRWDEIVEEQIKKKEKAINECLSLYCSPKQEGALTVCELIQNENDAIPEDVWYKLQLELKNDITFLDNIKENYHSQKTA